MRLCEFSRKIFLLTDLLPNMSLDGGQLWCKYFEREAWVNIYLPTLTHKQGYTGHKLLVSKNRLRVLNTKNVEKKQIFTVFRHLYEEILPNLWLQYKCYLYFVLVYATKRSYRLSRHGNKILVINNQTNQTDVTTVI